MEDTQKCLKYKYELLEGVQINNLCFRVDEEFKTEMTESEIGHRRLAITENGEIHGSLVLTGQPDKWLYDTAEERVKKKGKGKFYEFVFIDNPEGDNIRTYEVPNTKFEEFDFIYRDSDDWKFLKEKLYSDKRMPVFFRTDDKGNVIDFGIAQLYKLPYKYSANDLEKKRCGEQYGRADLSDCIFGYVHKSDNDSLKGRVQFSHFFCDDPEPKVLPMVSLTLSSPKATYYPIYVENGSPKNTYDNNDARLAGYKRYVLRKNIWQKSTSDGLDSKITPLAPETTFIGRIVFHNLKKEELGALLSALTFHGTKGGRHQMGQGKPYGYGCLKLEILDAVNDKGEQLQQNVLMGRFEAMMIDEMGDFRESRSFRKLLTISHIDNKVEAEDENYKYMNLSVNPNIDEFKTARKKEEFLKRFSNLTSQIKVGLDKSIAENIIHAKKKELEDRLRTEIEQIRQYIDTNWPLPEKPCSEQEKNCAIENCNNRKTYLEKYLSEKEKEKFISDLISECEHKKLNYEAMIFTQESIEDGISKRNTLGALFGFLKKNKEKISDSHLPAIKKRSLEIFDSLSQRDKKEYSNKFPSKKWNDLIIAIGENRAKEIFDELK